MKKRAGVFIKIFICILLIIILTGCWNRRELDTLGIVMGIGVDKPQEPGKIKLTAQVVKPGEIKSSKKEGGGGSGSDAYLNIEDTGDTVFSTLRDMTNLSSRKLFFPHNQVLIIGRSIAEEGVRKYVDFFTRDPETRNNVWVLVAQETAGEVLDVGAQLEKIPASNISKIVEGEAAATSQTLAVRLSDFLERLMSKTTAPVAPIIRVSGEGDKKIAAITGTAVFKDDKLVGKLDKSEGRGLLWILGKVKSGIINVEGPQNDKVSLEIIHAQSKLAPEIKGSEITMKIAVSEEGNIGEEMGTEDLSMLSEIEILEQRKTEVIRNEIMAAVKKAQELNADIFGLGDAVHKKYPKQWKSMESNWDEIFPNIKVEVKIEAKLRLMGRINKPAAPEQEKK